MAMYYQNSSEIQADGGLHTLYLMNPNYVGYSDAQPSMLFLNPTSSAAVMPHAPLHHHAQQHFMGIPLPHDPTRPLPPPALAHQQDIPPAAAQTPMSRHHYNMWGLVDQPQQTPRGLSLSLSAHHQTGFDKSPVSGDHDFGIMSPKNCSSPSLTTTESNGVNAMQSVIMGSKYLKAAQELLDEVVNVGNDLPEARKDRDKAKAVKNSGAATHRDAETGVKSELTAAQRQEIQMKKSKLNSMLDEVEQRCRQYHQQMQMVVATFEQAAGSGSARAYTQLALKTILKQFRCLKSTISAQIKGLNKSLGEEESMDHKFEGSRLKFVDNQLRQQRALQQLGMMQNNAWRPQRGLPERAVSVLRSWLFEHFLHPYPKDMDKQILAKQTGLTRSQVSNWFINARVRLWKPMVEEMYLEETKNHDASTKPQTDNKSARAAPSPPPEIPASTLTTTSHPARTNNLAHLINSLNTDNLQSEKSPKKPRNAVNLSSDNNQMEGGGRANVVKFSTENYLSMAAAANANRYGIGELDQQLAAAAGFQGSSFSLSLGLQPTESSQFLSHRGFEFGTRMESGVVEGGGIDEGGGASHPGSIGYEILDFQNRKPFPAQLLPDFVA